MEFKLETVQISDREFELIRKLVYDRSGIQLNDSKKSLVQGRLNKILRSDGFKSFRQYYDFLQEDKAGDSLVTMLDAISTNLTSFFREERHFNYLESNYLPNLLQQREASGQRSLRIWSAGCSSGEEPYSLAITMLENVANPKAWDLTLLATDISTKVLGKAVKGKYEKDRLKTMPFSVSSRYFDKVTTPGSRQEYFQAKDELRNLITFRRFNLMESFQFKRPFDIIFCRNVMIYFDKPTQQVLVDKYYRNLAIGGLLFVGHSESLTGIRHKFRYIEPTIYQRVQ